MKKHKKLEALKYELEAKHIGMKTYKNECDTNCCFIEVPYGALRLCEVFGLFDSFGVSECFLIVDYYNGNSFVEFSPAEAASRIRELVRVVNDKKWKGKLDNSTECFGGFHISSCNTDELVIESCFDGVIDIKAETIKVKHSSDSPVKDVIFNDPATIVLWSDGTKTVVKAQNGEKFDPEKGLAMAISKKAFGNNYDYYEVFNKYIGKYNKKKSKKTKKLAKDGIGDVIKDSEYMIKKPRSNKS